ncbi:hypothetical protein [Streptomyces roseicoloratus]|uniref:Translation initiation factor IF-2 n=1 Tax=Streptomyces roseicoloratus TaxID=2508722 RepID=A0ABY9RT05_9ACTN|nr:hypothetical protein [Streptomyces roseicoloratus]WMX45311.1 hypothetical protein RGF97_11235 [Streptomyces roseicoloratus]
MSPNETEGAEPSRRRRRHASKRRGPGPLWIAGSGAVVVCGILAAFAALDGGPASGGAGGPAPDEGGRPGMPALIQRDAGSPGEDDGAGDGGPATGPSASDGSASPSATAGGSTAPSAGPTPSDGANRPGPAASGSATASPSGRPGNSGQAPGIQRKQR